MVHIHSFEFNYFGRKRWRRRLWSWRVGGVFRDLFYLFYVLYPSVSKRVL
jgi:hypothetical protein